MAIPVKLTRAHQVTLPKRLLKQAGWLDQEFFVADLRGDYLVLKPLDMESRPAIKTFEDLQRHFAKVGITQKDVQKAVAWARQSEKSRRLRRQAGA